MGGAIGGQAHGNGMEWKGRGKGGTTECLNRRPHLRLEGMESNVAGVKCGFHMFYVFDTIPFIPFQPLH